MKLITLIFLFVFSMSCAQTVVGFCFSAADNPAEEAYNYSIAVFTGKVEKIEYSPVLGNIGVRGQIVTFKVYSVWKGSVEKQITIHGGDEGLTDVIYFLDGKEYLIYANSYDLLRNEWYISTCSLSSLLSENSTQSQVAYLNKTYPSYDPLPVTPKRKWLLLVIFVFVAIVMVGAIIVLRAIQKPNNRKKKHL